VNRGPAPLHHLERKRDVLAALGLEEDVSLTANGVDRAVSRGDAAELRLEATNGHLVTPVKPLLVGPTPRLERHLAAHVAHAGVGEEGDEPAKSARLPEAVR